MCKYPTLVVIELNPKAYHIGGAHGSSIIWLSIVYYLMQDLIFALQVWPDMIF